MKQLASSKNPLFFSALRTQTQAARTLEELLPLSALRRRAAHSGFTPEQRPLRLALIGGYTPQPLSELITHLLSTAAAPFEVRLHLGDYDNYTAEILGDDTRLEEFQPEAILFLPSHRTCQYTGSLLDPRADQEAAARKCAADILDLCAAAHRRTGAEIVLANFPLPAEFDPGSYRTRTAASAWNYRKLVNLELGLNAPSYVRVCDVEFLSARVGTAKAFDPRAWFETKQPYGRELMLQVAREAAHLIENLRKPSKKVAVLDLDNTLWGGVIGDDGLNGIEIGDTSPRGEAFKAFQQALLSLARRGVLLAVCSKNDHARAVEPFEQHPEMVLRMEHFASFQANWEPKSENIRRIAAELNLGLDSMVFIDDNPAEIDIVRQFVPEVETIHLSEDPSEYCGQLLNSRFFEPAALTSEDLERVDQYRQENQRNQLRSCVTDMGAYLESLDMRCALREFRAVDAPRIAQLINKSNQFNLTTRRRTEAEIHAILADSDTFGFTARLEDRFGDYGLISIVIATVRGPELEIDTWLMSCRVLKRQVEEEVLNEIVRLAALRGARQIRGVYLPTAKNGMVRDHYRTLGFTPAEETAARTEWTLEVAAYEPKPTRITITERAYDAK